MASIVNLSTEPVEPTPRLQPTRSFSQISSQSIEPVVPPVRPAPQRNIYEIRSQATEPVLPSASEQNFSVVQSQSVEPVEYIEHKTLAPIVSIDTTPIEPTERSKKASAVSAVDTGAAAVAGAAVGSTLAEKVGRKSPSPAHSPSSEKPSGFFNSMFGWKRRASEVDNSEKNVIATDETATSPVVDQGSPTEMPLKNISHNTRQPVETAEHGAQTELSADFFEELKKQQEEKGKRPLVFLETGQTSVDRGRRSPSVSSISSQRSTSRSKGMLETGMALRRPPSSSSMKDRRMPPLPSNADEKIAAAAAANRPSAETGSMGPPLIPASASGRNAAAAAALRPRTPSSELGSPNSKAGTTPRPRHVSMNSRGGDSSRSAAGVISPTGTMGTSIHAPSEASFASELDERFGMQAEALPNLGSGQSLKTDPRMIQAITQTMIGEYLWKYTRKAGRGNISQNRHRRYFWIHPYTRTLYWSDRDPSQGGFESRAKSVPIEAVRVVTDDNPFPPGLHRKSIVVLTPGRPVKFTAPTGQRHETWFNALSYLLMRTGGDNEEDMPYASHVTSSEDMREFDPQFRTGSIRGVASLSSYNSRTTRNTSDSPSRNTSALSNSRPSPVLTQQGSLSRLSNIFRSSGFGTFSSRRSKINMQTQASIYNASEVNDSAEDIRHEIERQERERSRLDNVRDCCDGKHNVSTLTKSPANGGARRSSQSTRRSHHHSHSQDAAAHNHE